MKNKIEHKLDKLKQIISRHNSAVIAFSGGVDSTFLARTAKDICGNVELITISFSAIPESEITESIKLAQELDLRHNIVNISYLDIPEFTWNKPDRCYHCKKYLFSKLKEYASENNFESILDGTNNDDVSDYRPGRKALTELGIISPLQEAGLSKDEIRKLSERYELKTSSKPSYACLASRIPYGEKITQEKLLRINKAEKAIRELGFSQFRARNHTNLARLEFLPEEMNYAWQQKNKIEQICREAGYTYISIDITGYRTGSLNETL